jgi:hypothetical protein
MATPSQAIHNLNLIRSAINDAAKAGAGDAARSIENYARALTAVPGPPRSSPGEPPRVDTGRLVASWSIRRGGGVGRWTAEVVNTAKSPRRAPYPAYLHTGTRKMAPRPYLDRAAAMAMLGIRSNTRSLVAAHVRAAVARAVG